MRSAREKDLGALQTAIVCVGLSGVFLGLFVMLAGGGSPQVSGACIGIGLVVALLGVTRLPAANMSRPWRIVAYWSLSALLLLELMVPLNYAGVRRRTSWDWTELKLRELSEQTVNIVSVVDRPVYVTTFFVQSHPVHKEIFGVVSDLLDEYAKLNRNVIIEHIDPAREKGKMLALRERMDLRDRTGTTAVIVQSGRNRQFIDLRELLPTVRPGPPSERQQVKAEDVVFFGEKLLTSAIVRVTTDREKVLYFVTNHGELSPDGREFLPFAAELRRANYRVKKFEGLEEGVPQDCAVLLILGPKEPLSYREMASIRRFLGTGGKLFCALDPGPATRLEPELGGYSINVGRDIIFDARGGEATFSVRVRAPVTARGHPVVSSLRDRVLRFDLARTVEAMPPKPAMLGSTYVRAHNLLVTGRTAWGETDIDTYINTGFVQPDRGRDRNGPLGVAAVHEQPDVDPKGNPFPEEMPRTRIVAVGSSRFMLATRFGGETRRAPQANVAFFFNAVHWLAETREMIAIPPRPFGLRELDKMDESDRRIVFWLMTVFMPASFLLMGGVIWLVRRRY